jgi:predicted metal-binding membrane protein
MGLLAGLHRHDRLIVVALLLGVMLVSWLYLLAGMDIPMPAMDGMAMDGMAMPMAAPDWTATRFLLMLAMWLAMMAVMMLPGAVPMLLFYESIAQKRRSPAIGRTLLFALGYLLVWLGFSIGAVALQYGLDRAGLLSPLLRTTSTALSGAVLIAAGLYQWTSLKQACLRQCRSPLDFVMTGWRNGNGGALSMGLRHGVFCLGCCWMLMLLLFVGGIMNFAWIIGIALFVMVEKLAPAGHWIGKAAGAAMIVWGGLVLASLAPIA